MAALSNSTYGKTPDVTMADNGDRILVAFGVPTMGLDVQDIERIYARVIHHGNGTVSAEVCIPHG